jgi:hypothetical protein
MLEEPLTTEIITIDKTEKAMQYRFWSDNTNKAVYNGLLNGLTMSVIAEANGISTVKVQEIICNKFFMAKLQSFLNGIILANNAAKIMASEDVFNKLWSRVKDNVDDIPVEICLKELARMLPNKSGSINIHKPGNVVINPEERKEPLDKDFGYEGLDDEGLDN